MPEYRQNCKEEDVSIFLPVQGGTGMRRTSRHPGQCTHPEMRAAMAQPRSLDAGRATEPPSPLNRAGTINLASSELSLKQVCKRCCQVALKEAEKLPEDEEKLRLARLSLPTNRTASLLRSGKSFDAVARDAALRVVERWVGLLRAHVAPYLMARTISNIVHPESEQPALTVSVSRGMSLFDSRGAFRNESGLLVLLPSPMPPDSSTLAAALRKVVPEIRRTGERWRYVEDLLSAMSLEDCFDQSAPTHVQFPNSTRRAELKSMQKLEEEFEQMMAPDFEKQKNRSDAGQGGHPERRTSLGTSVQLRLSGFNGGWATYKQGDCARLTCWNYLPQVIQGKQNGDDVPGPGTYQKPASACRTNRSGQFPSVGKMRIVASEVLLSRRERFS